MVATPTQVRRIVQRYVRALQSRIHVERVILYGSYATGRAHEWSDIDIVVVSPDFARMNELERVQFLARRTVHFDSRLAPLAYTPTEFDHAQPYQFPAEIKRTGKVVFEARRRLPRAAAPSKRRAVTTRVR